MIAYLDTSSLVKLYIEEKGSQDTRDLVSNAEIIATSLVAYPEARAAFARRHRENAFATEEYRRLVRAFDGDWEHYLNIRVTDELVLISGQLAEKHGLRGFGAIHLASAMILDGNVSASVLFSCYDQRLQQASELENLRQPVE